MAGQTGFIHSSIIYFKSKTLWKQQNNWLQMANHNKTGKTYFRVRFPPSNETVPLVVINDPPMAELRISPQSQLLWPTAVFPTAHGSLPALSLQDTTCSRFFSYLTGLSFSVPVTGSSAFSRFGQVALLWGQYSSHLSLSTHSLTTWHHTPSYDGDSQIFISSPDLFPESQLSPWLLHSVVRQSC